MKKLLLISLVPLSAFAQAQQKTITGFTETSVTKQLKTETQFDALLSSKRISATLKELSAQPHHLGSPGSKAVAEKIFKRLKDYGFDAQMQTYRVLFPT